ncbi:ATP-binding cassette domain-containing protein, partial [Corynebacterium sp.]|uniref:ATP-binding cassette domain-containing protein n=1 Tax=Corynebacterium sp. TaxID=1720 RepID=UPI0026DC2A5E
MLIEVSELRFSYKKTKSVLDGISCTFSGGINIVLGSNGAGKSTLMKILATELEPQSGVTRYDGKTAERKNRPTIVSRLGWVPQHNAVDTSQTVRDLVQT